MGRTRINISEELLEEIDRMVGPGGRSRFLEAAARERLDRLAMEEARRGGRGGPEEAEYRPWRDRRSTAPTRQAPRRNQTS
jgi:metal-responsive CopG/Arc/MetJ family transcriptional regulator